jgi:RNA polymerase sigma factor (sigma-70 family)
MTDGIDVGALVRRAAGGDQAAWNTLVDEYAGRVWAVARSHRLSEADAADVCQTTWLRAVEHIARLDRAERFGAWLVTTARRESLAVLRHNARHELSEGSRFDQLEARDAAPGDELVLAERDAALLEALEGLAPQRRALMRMLAADPAPSYEEISASLGIPIGSIGPTRARCLAELRRHVALLEFAEAA